MTKRDKAAEKEARAAWAAAIEARLARLEARLAGGDPAPLPEALATAGTEGRLRLSLRADPGRGLADWRHEGQAAALLAADWAGLAARLGALGHPARLAILRAALPGPATAAALQQAAGTATPGQFYHHLRELTAAGWLAAERRGHYAVPPARAGALLALISAAG